MQDGIRRQDQPSQARHCPSMASLMEIEPPQHQFQLLTHN
jgi:hypothetical protein